MAGRSDDGKRWVEILETLRPELPGTWSLRGGGLNTKLVREPIEWTMAWIGASKASSVRTHAGVTHFFAPELVFRLGVYGLDMADVRGGPRSIELGTDGDLDVARTFVRHALARIDELTPERYAERAEITLAALSGDKLPSNYLLMAPGWRVVNDSGDPVEAVEGCVEWMTRRWGPDSESSAPYVRFYGLLTDAWKAGGREQALAFLTEHRQRQLAEQGYDTPR